MRLFDRSIPSLARTFVFVAMLALTSFATRVHAQGLFDGLPDPSMDNYADMWETITSLDYREDASALFVGEHIADDFYELVAFQAETQPGNSVAEVVGTIQIVDTYSWDWLLPYIGTYTYDDGMMAFDFTIDFVSSTASVWVESDNGFSSPAVVVVGDMTIETDDGDGTFKSITPLGFVDNVIDACEIAERIAIFEPYEGDPIDPNTGRSGPEDPDGGLPPGAKCLNAYRTSLNICQNKLNASLRKCNLPGVAGGVTTGCAAGILACKKLKIPVPKICCVVGGLGGGSAVIAVCRSNAMINFDTCEQNAWLKYKLCMQNNLGVIVVDK